MTSEPRQSEADPTSRAKAGTRRPANRRWDAFWDTVSGDFFLGLAAGAGAGCWFAYASSVRENEGTIVLAMAGVSAALLAVSLAALALIAGLFETAFKEIFARIGATFADFARPFKIVAVTSGLGAAASLFGAMDSTSGDEGTRDLGGPNLRAALFALSVALVVWGIMAAIQAVFFVIRDLADASENTEHSSSRAASQRRFRRGRRRRGSF